MDETVTLVVGQPAPQFSVKDGEGNEQNLKTLNSSGKSVVLYFYPKDDTPGCTVQACDFRDSLASLANSNVVVLGVSKDSAGSHAKFTDKYNLNFPLLLDEDMSLHHSYGVWREKMNYGKTYMGTVRSTFIIAADGNLSHVLYNVRAKGHVERIKGLLEIGE